jgi:hypothetical protein
MASPWSESPKYPYLQASISEVQECPDTNTDNLAYFKGSYCQPPSQMFRTVANLMCRIPIISVVCLRVENPVMCQLPSGRKGHWSSGHCLVRSALTMAVCFLVIYRKSCADYFSWSVSVVSEFRGFLLWIKTPLSAVCNCCAVCGRERTYCHKYHALQSHIRTSTAFLRWLLHTIVKESASFVHTSAGIFFGSASGTSARPDGCIKGPCVFRDQSFSSFVADEN